MTNDLGSGWPARFDAFTARKTREAVSAPLAPLTTVEEANAAGRDAIGNAWSRRLFDGPFYVTRAVGASTRPACSLVFVQSADGNTGADDPATLGGGETDKHVIYEGLSRVAADAVMAGAGTVRGGAFVFSVWHPEMIALRASLGLRRHPVQIVATNRGIDVERMLLFNVPQVDVVLITGPMTPPALESALRTRPWVTRVPIDDGDWRGVFEQLYANGIRTISCVGGRTLGRALLRAGLVNDVYLTTTARRGGEPDTPLAPGQWRGPTILRKAGTGPDRGVVFEHIVPAVRP